MLIPEDLAPGPKNLTLFLCTPNQLIDVTRHCQAHAIPIVSKLPDMQASVFIESIGDLRNIIDFLRMLNLQTARKGPGGSLSIPALHTSEGK